MNRDVALKIVKSAKHYTETAMDEIKLLQKVVSGDPTDPGTMFVVQLLDDFCHSGVHGKHVCMVFEVLGENLLSLIRRYRHQGIPQHLVRQIAAQVLLGLNYLQSKCRIIHTDLKPENVLVVLSDNPKDIIHVKIADLGNACWVDCHFTSDIQTRQYRCPEVILGADWSFSADIWSIGCLVFELLTGDYLFDPQPGRDYSKDDDHIGQIIELLGHFPESVWRNGKYASKFFSSSGHLRKLSNLKMWGLPSVLAKKYSFPQHEAQMIASFILPMIQIHPAKRASPMQAFKHPWLDGYRPPNLMY